MLTVVILEVQWGYPRDEAPAFFKINPHNHTGVVLNSLLGHDDFLVTNACREVVRTAKDRGTPDPVRLGRNLSSLGSPAGLLLVCGVVARRTLASVSCEYPVPLRTVFMPHPACRWRSSALDVARTAIRLAVKGEGPTQVEITL